MYVKNAIQKNISPTNNPFFSFPACFFNKNIENIENIDATIIDIIVSMEYEYYGLMYPYVKP